MAEDKKINFEVKEFNKVEMDLDDFKWLISNLFYTCNAVGCIPNMQSIENANEVLQVIYKNNLNLYID